MAFQQFGMEPIEGLLTDMRAVRKDYFLDLPYHQAIMNDGVPLSVGGGIGQSRTMMSLLRKAHLGEVSVTVWPDILKEMCAERGIYILK